MKTAPPLPSHTAASKPTTEFYADCQRRLARGWNTWSTYSLLSHVRLPEGLCVNLSLKTYHEQPGRPLQEVHVCRRQANKPEVTPGLRAQDGSYTSLVLKWAGVEIQVESGTHKEELLLLITPLNLPRAKAPLLLVDVGFMWNRLGAAWRETDCLIARSEEGRTFAFFASEIPVDEFDVPYRGNFLALPLGRTLSLREGIPAEVEEVRALLGNARQRVLSATKEVEHAEMRGILQSCLAWDTIFDPGKNRVISPVSRLWNVNWGGNVLFCWDTYFAAWLAAGEGNRDLAYANAMAITQEVTPEGFVPNFSGANGSVSYDRSQPPIGALTFRFLHRCFGDLWPVEESFDTLLTWNRWWPKNRQSEGFLCWGSNPFPSERRVGFKHDNSTRPSRFAAALESGLDNSPMYDDVPFDAARHQIALADVGLMSLYVADCDALADLAALLQKSAEERELRTRAEAYRAALGRLWCEDAGIFLNLRLDTGEFSRRISPTCFYPLLARAATPAQARRMMDEHFLNPRKFFGEWMLPSIARDDAAYGDNTYWRGRIWAPLNFLVYLGLCQYDLPAEREILREKSAKLILKEWQAKGHVYENYNAETGEGGDVINSDPFYHWGALLALIPLLDPDKLTFANTSPTSLPCNPISTSLAV
ncbi:MAG: trehalase family glycosidase [Verrucomicrobiia bacterium]